MLKLFIGWWTQNQIKVQESIFGLSFLHLSSFWEALCIVTSSMPSNRVLSMYVEAQEVASIDILGKIYRIKRTNLPVGPFLINRLVTNLPVGPFLIYRLRWGLQPVGGRFATGCDWSIQCKMWLVRGSDLSQTGPILHCTDRSQTAPQPVTNLTSTGSLERDQPVDLSPTGWLERDQPVDSSFWCGRFCPKCQIEFLVSRIGATGLK